MATVPDHARRRSRATESRADPVVSEAHGDAPEQLSLLDDEHAREILVTLTSGPQGGGDLIERCSGSRPTVYRRLNRLEDAGLITAETTLDPNGHHHKAFRIEHDRLTVTIEDGVIAVTATHSPER